MLREELKRLAGEIFKLFAFSVAVGCILVVALHLFCFWFFGTRISVGEPNILLAFFEFLLVAIGGLFFIIIWKKNMK